MFTKIFTIIRNCSLPFTTHLLQFATHLSSSLQCSLPFATCLLGCSLSFATVHYTFTTVHYTFEIVRYSVHYHSLHVRQDVHYWLRSFNTVHQCSLLFDWCSRLFASSLHVYYSSLGCSLLFVIAHYRSLYIQDRSLHRSLHIHYSLLHVRDSLLPFDRCSQSFATAFATCSLPVWDSSLPFDRRSCSQYICLRSRSLHVRYHSQHVCNRLLGRSPYNVLVQWLMYCSLSTCSGLDLCLGHFSNCENW